MKKYPVFYIALCMAVLCFILPQCKKHTTRLNITLYNQPLSVIQKYVSGKWKLEYTYGGIIANLRSDYHDKNYIWQIDEGSHIKKWDMGNLFTDTTIEWYQYTYGGGDKIFVMKFYDDRQYPYNYIVWGIVDDSLVLRDFGSDPVTYHFSKQN